VSAVRTHAVVFVVAALAASARADDKVPCDKPHVHYAFVGAPAKASPKQARDKLDELARALTRDGYSAFVNGTSDSTCSDGENLTACPDNHFWLQLVADDTQLRALVAVNGPHMPSQRDGNDRNVALAKAPYRPLRAFGTMSIAIECRARP
jgi:hypothetical protein